MSAAKEANPVLSTYSTPEERRVFRLYRLGLYYGRPLGYEAAVLSGSFIPFEGLRKAARDKGLEMNGRSWDAFHFGTDGWELHIPLPIDAADSGRLWEDIKKLAPHLDFRDYSGSRMKEGLAS